MNSQEMLAERVVVEVKNMLYRMAAKVIAGEDYAVYVDAADALSDVLDLWSDES